MYTKFGKITQAMLARLHIAHMLINYHENNMETVQCQHCDYKAADLKTITDHIETDHQEFALLNHLARNQTYVSQAFDTFKDELTNVLNKIIDGHNSIKQELFIFRQSNYGTERLDKIEASVTNLTRLVQSSQLPATAPASPPPTKPASPRTEVSDPPSKPDTNIRNICIIGDSISGNVDHKVIENAVKSKVRSSRAYSSVNETCENDARCPTKFPEKGFNNVISKELEKEPTDVLIIQAGSVDISNFKTGGENATKFSEYFRQETIVSAENLFKAATNALLTRQSLKKVILMKQTPRYDTASSDPHSVKAALSKLFNDTICQLWLESPLKSKLIIGSHNLDCAGGVKESRYRNTHRNLYDGVHMYGPSGKKAYTESVLNILRIADLIKSPPPPCYRRYHKMVINKPPTQDKYECPTQDTDWKNDRDIRYKMKPNQVFQYAVPTTNRFNYLSQGNC